MTRPKLPRGDELLTHPSILELEAITTAYQSRKTPPEAAPTTQSRSKSTARVLAASPAIASVATPSEPVTIDTALTAREPKVPQPPPGFPGLTPRWRNGWGLPAEPFWGPAELRKRGAILPAHHSAAIFPHTGIH